MRQAKSASSLAHSAAGRLFGVFWGSLVVVDVARLTHMRLAAATVAVLIVVAVASWRQAPVTMLAAAGVGWMFVNGFVVNQFGQLAWDGAPDFWRLLLLMAVALSAGRSGDLDGFLAHAAHWRRPARVRSHAELGDAGDSMEQERHAVGR